MTPVFKRKSTSDLKYIGVKITNNIIPGKHYKHKTGKIADNQHFLPLPQYIPKSFSPGSLVFYQSETDISIPLSQTTNFRLFQTERNCIRQFQI